MGRKKKIIVVGAGMGGLATARALLDRGFDVEVFERANELAEVGAGIQLAPNAIKVIRALGLEDDLARYAFRPRSVVGYDWKTARVTFRTPLEGVVEQLYGAGYVRARIDICHETVRFWWNRSGSMFAAEIKKRRIHSRSYSQGRGTWTKNSCG